MGQSITRVAAAQSDKEVTPDEEYDIVARYESTLRALPLGIGALGIVGVLLNRTFSGIAPVVDATSSQSRADVLVIVMSAVLLLTGLSWLSLKSRPIEPVEPDGVIVSYIDESLPSSVAAELSWAWEALDACTRCVALVVIYQGRCILHQGFAARNASPADVKMGPICAKAIKSGTGNYLANLVFYPGRVEFVPYLPENIQGVVVQPIGEDGVLIAATDTQRGFSRLDQAWAATIADKLDQSLSSVASPTQPAEAQT
ncbi:hypothetical protein WJX72_001075 [[Myrmecia] bisecta]|uniref:Cofactor assembly of complex C subunit B n=1 Tax=[Myrmecia] bisecta TaxID=41462 RepID=A0AAW1QE40_9CHLO